MNMLIRLLVVGLTLFSIPAIGAEHSQLNAFPAPNEGMERIVIELPHKERGEEDSFKVELVPGKMMLTDGINRTRIGLSIIAHPLKGWGYTFYEVTGNAMAMSTLIAVPENAQKINEFVHGSSLDIRYNSRLPIVIYVPKGYEIHYRIWNAGKLQRAIKG